MGLGRAVRFRRKENTDEGMEKGGWRKEEKHERNEKSNEGITEKKQTADQTNLTQQNRNKRKPSTTYKQ
jgi:hypothetical protein